MNERIEKLYGQSFVTDNYVNVGPNGTELGIRFDPEKFAELLIRDCAKSAVLFADSTTIQGLPSKYIENYMLHHFGVTEE